MDFMRLRYEIAKKGITITKFCEQLKMSRSAFYRKCTGSTEFTLSEIEKILELLNLDSPMDIFFTKKVS